MFSEMPQTDEELIPSGIPTVYLDTNILVGLHEGRMETARQKLMALIAQGRLICPFTAEQLDEFVAPIRSVEDRMQRMMTLSNLSIDRFYRATPIETGFCHRSPFQVFDDISRSGFTRCFQETLSNLFPIETIKALQQEYGIDHGALANKEVDHAIEFINEKLRNYVPKNNTASSARPTSLEETLQLVINVLKSTSPLLLKTNGTRIVLLFSLLESFGFRTDSAREYKKGSRFPDARHVSLAAGFDYLVSNDRKMISKASAVYRFLGFSVCPLNLQEFETSVLDELRAS